ncbi:MAG: hypothetical protein VSS75_004070 [Candidatus Parabeggiatoa sp.]|nr:hypothetical protein [Candidatus Parabeggiatoa sp.]
MLYSQSSQTLEQRTAHSPFEIEGNLNNPESDGTFYPQQEQSEPLFNGGIIEDNQACQNNSPLCGLQIALASDSPSEVYAQTTHSPPHFYVKLQRMTSSKAQCKQTAMIAMAKSGFTDILSGKHGIWGVKDGYKAQIKCSQKEKVIVFIVVGSEGKMVMILNDQLQHNFGKGFSKTRDL